MQDRHVTVYNTENINSWVREVEGIPALISDLKQKISNLEPDISRLTAVVTPLASALHSINAQISSYETQQFLDSVGHVASAMSESNHHSDHHGHHGGGYGSSVQGQPTYTSHHYHSSHHHGHHTDVGSTVGAIVHGVNDISIALTLSRLRDERDNLQRQYAPLQSQLDEKKRYQSVMKSSVRQYEQRMKLLNETHIPKAREFLGDLWTVPKTLVEEKVKELEKSFDDYLRMHPLIDQPEATRRALYQIKTRLNTLIAERPPATSPEAEYEGNYPDISQIEFDIKNPEEQQRIFHDKENLKVAEWQKKYAIVTGFIAKMLEEAREANEDSRFINYLYSCLNVMHIAENGDLPDQAKTNRSCKQHFAEIADQFPMLYKIDRDEFRNIEESGYETALANFEKFANQAKTPQHRMASLLIDSIKEDVKADRDKIQRPNYPMYTEIATLGATVFDPRSSHSAKQDALSELLGFVDKLPGASSTKRKVLGCFIGFLGVSLVVGSILLFPPISPFGAVIGTTLLAQGLLIMGGALGVGLTAVGSTLFHFGRERGTAKQASHFIKAAAKAGPGSPSPERESNQDDYIPPPVSRVPVEDREETSEQYPFLRNF